MKTVFDDIKTKFTIGYIVEDLSDEINYIKQIDEDAEEIRITVSKDVVERMIINNMLVLSDDYEAKIKCISTDFALITIKRSLKYSRKTKLNEIFNENN